jgi:acetylornithine deacetylase
MPNSSNNPIQIQPDRLKNLIKEMVNIYSPSGKEEEILEFTEQYLKNQGLPVIRQEVDENRYNLLVLPDEDNIDLCYVGHLDTVSAYDLDDFGFSEEGGTIHGLGTADMKAGCAAMIETFTALQAGGGKFPAVGLALVVGEEVDNSGAKTLAREYSFPWALVGEPTNLTVMLGHYGYLEVWLRTRGKRAHSSMPELGQNAIESMLKLLLRITEYATTSQHGLVYNIRELSGFPSGFVVPDTCEAYVDLHLPPHSKIDTLKTELEHLVEKAGKDIPGLDAVLRFEEARPGYRISNERLLVQKLQKIYQQMNLPWEPQDFRSHSDANILWSDGVDPIILGPGRLEEAHTPEESVSWAQVLEAAEIYLNFALAL